MDFGRALALIKNGGKVYRSGWNGRNMWVALMLPHSGSDMTSAYIFMKTAQDALVPWLASQSDILAEDWHEVPGSR